MIIFVVGKTIVFCGYEGETVGGEGNVVLVVGLCAQQGVAGTGFAAECGRTDAVKRGRRGLGIALHQCLGTAQPVALRRRGAADHADDKGKGYQQGCDGGMGGSLSHTIIYRMGSILIGIRAAK